MWLGEEAVEVEAGDCFFSLAMLYNTRVYERTNKCHRKCVSRQLHLTDLRYQALGLHHVDCPSERLTTFPPTTFGFLPCAD